MSFKPKNLKEAAENAIKFTHSLSSFNDVVAVLVMLAVIIIAVTAGSDGLFLGMALVVGEFVTFLSMRLVMYVVWVLAYSALEQIKEKENV